MFSFPRAFISFVFTCLLLVSSSQAAENEAAITLSQLKNTPQSFHAQPDASGTFTWWLPPHADRFVLPISAGMIVEATNAPLMHWFTEGSPWDLTDLPLFGVRYGDRTIVVIIPWPHYAELIFTNNQVGVRFEFPVGRHNATPCDLVALTCRNDPLAVAEAFRQWRETAPDTGAIPRPDSLADKAKKLSAVDRLFGAPHIYLWGPALFSRHDVYRGKWISFAQALWHSAPETFSGRLLAQFTAAQRASLNQLTTASWPQDYLTLDVAAAIDNALASPVLLGLPTNTPLAEIVHQNSQALAAAERGLVHDPATWGDGFSQPTLQALHSAGITHALLLLSDFYGHSPRPDLVAQAAAMGYLIGPYDSYHSIHDPKTPPAFTWETAQFDEAAYVNGRVLNPDGSGRKGFKGRGYYFSPAAAWPYVRQRVQSALSQTPYSAWFMDCDATAECFDDYNPLHPATKADDIRTRRARLHWLGADKQLVVGSEGGSALFADVIDFGHGIQTPYISYMSPEFKDPHSPSFLGNYWPSDTPAYYFKPVPVPAALMTPYFDPSVRIPLYRAALGDDVIATHHWCYDSFKFSNVADERELMELLYMVPPMYHLNRETWPPRRSRILRHYAYWSPLHEQLATAPLTRFEWLTPDRQLQRTTFHLPAGDVTMTVNFSDVSLQGFPPKSATAAGKIDIFQAVYRVGE